MTKKREPIFVKQNRTDTLPIQANDKILQRHIDLKKKELELEKRKERIYHCLPHLYGYKWYRWARTFYEDTHKVALLTAGNQLSKSSTMIRKCIDWATDKNKWKKLWPEHDMPRLFWYFYPSATVATTEIDTKWIPEFLPREEFKDDPVYGWKLYYDKKGMVEEIQFNSGVKVQFKFYSQAAINLQSSTVYAMFVDEELPLHLYDELMFRLHATDGYFNSVFTATLGQEFWREAMECVGMENEKLPDAMKMQISAYDCMYYEDGTPGPWTAERIEAAKRKCKSESEIQKRIYGRFIMDEGLKVPTFNPDKHFVKPFPIPSDYSIYAGVDTGSGGTNHPAAIGFIAVAPNNRVGFVFRGWRGDGVVTTAGDILDKYNELAHDLVVTRKVADPRAVDFHNIAIRSGTPFEKAESKHEVGETTINTLFKNDMLFIFDDPELRKLGTELSTLSSSTPKNVAKDDFYDFLRYCSVSIPWDWNIISDKLSESQKNKPTPKPESKAERELRERRGRIMMDMPDEENEDWSALSQEMEFWNGQYE